MKRVNGTRKLNVEELLGFIESVVIDYVEFVVVIGKEDVGF